MVDPEVRVAVGDEEGVAEQRQRAPERTGGSDGLGPVERVAHVESEARSVPDGLGDLLAEMTDARTRRVERPAPASRRSWWKTNGSPDDGARAFGVSSRDVPQA